MSYGITQRIIRYDLSRIVPQTVTQHYEIELDVLIRAVALAVAQHEPAYAVLVALEKNAILRESETSGQEKSSTKANGRGQRKRAPAVVKPSRED